MIGTSREPVTLNAMPAFCPSCPLARPPLGRASRGWPGGSPPSCRGWTLAEAIETTHIHRVAGRTGGRTAWVTTRPCRAPHQTISDAGLIGGGHVPTSGEGSFSHNGVLFLDAQPVCPRQVLEVWRQPLGEGVLCIQSPTRHRSQRFRWFSYAGDGRGRCWQRAVTVYHHRDGYHAQSGSPPSTPASAAVLCFSLDTGPHLEY
jgi:Magnesium chelatase, subunit ChlI